MIEAIPSKPEADAAAIGDLFGSALIQGSELWMNIQKELLANTGAIMDSWLQLHRAALDTSSRALQRLHECSNLVEVFELQQEWASSLWGWTVTTLPAVYHDSAHVGQKAVVRSREPAETGRTGILVRREPAKRSAAEMATATE